MTHQNLCLGKCWKLFWATLTQESHQIQSLLEHLEEDESVQELIQPATRKLAEDKAEQWKRISCEESLKSKLTSFHFIAIFRREKDFVSLTTQMMTFDKHGPLDLILFSDNHEEIRKWARNQIREMKIGDLKQRMERDWARHLEQPSEENILSTADLNGMARSLAAKAETVRAFHIPIQLCDREKITRDDAYRSACQPVTRRPRRISHSLWRPPSVSLYIALPFLGGWYSHEISASSRFWHWTGWKETSQPLCFNGDPRWKANGVGTAAITEALMSAKLGRLKGVFFSE